MQQGIKRLIIQSYNSINSTNFKESRIDIRIKTILANKIEGLTAPKEITGSDNDDTFCALALLHKTDPDRIDGTTLAHIVKNLIACEVTEAGPYITWIPAATKKVARRKSATTPSHTLKDCDIGVNANIGYFLDMIGVHPNGLMSYIDTCIKTSTYTSAYYCSPSSIIYLLARWYRGDQHEKLLADCAFNQSEDGSWSDSLSDTLFRTISLLYLTQGKPNEKYAATIDRSISWLVDHVSSGKVKIESFPLYRELVSISTGGYQAIGSAAYTHALIIECFELYLKARSGSVETTALSASTTSTATTSIPSSNLTKLPHHDTKLNDHVLSKVHENINTAISQLPPHIRPIMDKARTAFVKNDTSHEMTLLPLWIWKCLKSEFREKIPLSSIEKICEASVYGWISYSIFDSIVDKHMDSHLDIFAAMTSDRHLHSIYAALLHDAPIAHKGFESIIARMDNAIIFETSVLPYTRTSEQSASKTNRITLHPANIYKAWGHALGPLMIAHLLGFESESRQHKGMHDFFYHYLAARTLSDDAHDWKDDMKADRDNPVTHALTTLNPEQDSDTELQKSFWMDILPEVSQKIQLHCHKAYAAARESELFDTEKLPNFIVNPHEVSARHALISRKKMVDFLNAW